MKQILSGYRLITRGWPVAAFFSIIIAAISTAVTLMGFTATPEGNAIVIRWQTGSELDAAGFMVIRSTDEVGYDPVGPVGDEYVPATGNAAGASYIVTDTDVERGVTYYYILDSYDTSNHLDETGPITAILPLTPTATSTATSKPTTPAQTPTATSTASSQSAQTGPATATPPPTNTPTPLSVSTVTPSAPRASAPTATLRPTVASTAPAGATAAATATTVAPATTAAFPTARATSVGSGAQPVPIVSAPRAASSTPDQSAGRVDPVPTEGALVAMEPMVIATSAAPVAGTPTSSSGLNAFMIGLLVLAVLLVGAGLFAILRQTHR